MIMNWLTTDKRAAIIRALVEGNSISATYRTTGAAKVAGTNCLSKSASARGLIGVRAATGPRPNPSPGPIRSGVN